jgi:hypothetical protein
MEGIFEKLGGRKYFFVLFCTLFAWIAFFIGKIDFQQLTTFLGVIGSGYFAANTVAKWSPEQRK